MRAILLLATTAAASPLAPMWAQLRENARLGALANTTECHVRLLTYEYALGLQAERAPMLEVFDALELNTTCGVGVGTKGKPGGAPVASWHSSVTAVTPGPWLSSWPLAKSDGWFPRYQKAAREAVDTSSAHGGLPPRAWALSRARRRARRGRPDALRSRTCRTRR